MTVRKLRLNRGWTQEQLAELTGLSVRSIQRIERGEPCSLETQNSLAAVFEVERSILGSSDAAPENKASLTTEEVAAIEHVKGLKDLYSHVFMYVFFVVIVGFAFGFEHPLMLWGSIGWGAGVIGHGLAVYGVIDIFDSDWEMKQIEKRLGRQLRVQPTPVKRPLDSRNATFGHETLIQVGRLSMKNILRLSGSAALMTGMALLTWVSYDATTVMQSLGLQSRMDEAAVAVVTLSLGVLLVVLGIYSWRRTREAVAARATVSGSQT